MRQGGGAAGVREGRGADELHGSLGARPLGSTKEKGEGRKKGSGRKGKGRGRERGEEGKGEREGRGREGVRGRREGKEGKERTQKS